jgi:hypothetical protein
MTDDKKIRLTPKGWLTVELMDKKHGKDVNVDKLWADLTKFVARQAKDNGMPDGGLPCLVLVEGGHCITAGNKK